MADIDTDTTDSKPRKRINLPKMTAFTLAAAFAAMIGTTDARRVHPFFAENNYICEMCQRAVRFGAQGKLDEMSSLYIQHPALETRMNEYMRENGYECLNFDEPKESCVDMHLCSKEDIFELLLEEQPLDLSVHIETVNSDPTSNWVAGVNSKFEGASLKEIKSVMGTIVDPDWVVRLPEKQATSPLEISDAEGYGAFTETFDARIMWPECESVIGHVRDQSNCGSCWAFGTTEALNDRACIATSGTMTTLYSTADTTACCDGEACDSFGCGGGQISTPWSWFQSVGVVSGGAYGEGSLCYDYTMPKCAHHVTVEGMISCDDVTQVQPTCVSSCPSNTSMSFSGDKRRGYGAYYLSTNPTAIKQDIWTYGTVTADFTVYEDFLTYKSGVYSHKTGSSLGGHAIKVIGWGSEGGEDYWLCVNSWNDTWGDNGTFKILQGNCNINTGMTAGQPMI